MKDLTLLEPKNPIFENEVIVNMIKYKWTTYGRKFFFRESLAILIFLIVFIIQVVLYSRGQARGTALLEFIFKNKLLKLIAERPEFISILLLIN